MRERKREKTERERKKEREKVCEGERERVCEREIVCVCSYLRYIRGVRGRIKTKRIIFLCGGVHLRDKYKLD